MTILNAKCAPRLFGALALALWGATTAAGQTVTIAGKTYAIERIGGVETPGASNDAGDFTQPTFVTQSPGDNDHIYVVERSDAAGIGRIVKYNTTSNTSSTFVDINGSLAQDGGLLSMAFHPHFDTNGRFYVSLVEGTTSKVVEYDAHASFSSRTILSYDQPAGAGVLHTVNWVGFQPGGDADRLFVTAGDGGFQANNANIDTAIIESLDSPYGKLLSIDVAAATDFTTPISGLNYDTGTGNGLGADARVDVVANGFRNPYRASFDSTGGLFIADVGFQTIEEVNYLTAAQLASATAEDFGWTSREGSVATPTSIGGPAGPHDMEPVFEYLHPGVDAGSIGYTGQTSIRGSSITGGYTFDGRYFFGDFVTGEVYSGVLDGGVLTDVQQHDADFEAALGDGISFITSFGTDNQGNLYIVDFGNKFFADPGTGEIFRVINTPEPGAAMLLAAALLAIASLSRSWRSKGPKP